MIARVWKGAVGSADGARYAEYMRETGLAEYAATPGNHGAWMLRRTVDERTAFVMFTLWEDLDAVKAFAGEDYETAVFYPEDDAFLIERDLVCAHFEAEAASSLRGAPVLTGERVVLRPDHPDDVEALTSMLAEPEVARWWGDNDADAVRADLGSGFAILIDDEVQGWLQCHEETTPEYPSVAFDIALTTARHGRGYGQEALRLAIRHFISRGHHRFTIDPAAENERAIRSYAALGFKPVGILRAYERAPDGMWRDGLLMDLLASEFVE